MKVLFVTEKADERNAAEIVQKADRAGYIWQQTCAEAVNTGKYLQRF